MGTVDCLTHTPAQSTCHFPVVNPSAACTTTGATGAHLLCASSRTHPDAKRFAPLAGFIPPSPAFHFPYSQSCLTVMTFPAHDTSPPCFPRKPRRGGRGCFLVAQPAPDLPGRLPPLVPSHNTAETLLHSHYTLCAVGLRFRVVPVDPPLFLSHFSTPHSTRDLPAPSSHGRRHAAQAAKTRTAISTTWPLVSRRVPGPCPSPGFGAGLLCSGVVVCR
jgi:hypothetical protein